MRFGRHKQHHTSLEKGIPWSHIIWISRRACQSLCCEVQRSMHQDTAWLQSNEVLLGIDRKPLQQGLFAQLMRQQRKIPTESKLCNLKFVWQRMVLVTRFLQNVLYLLQPKLKIGGYKIWIQFGYRLWSSKTKIFIEEKKKNNPQLAVNPPRAQYFTELCLCKGTEMANRLVTARKECREETSSFV